MPRPRLLADRSQPCDELLRGLQRLQRLAHHLRDDLAGWLDVLDAADSLAHDRVAEVVQVGLLLLQVLLERNDTLGCKLLDLSRPLLLPLLGILTLLDPHRPAREDDR